MPNNEEPQIDNWKDAWEYNAAQTRDALLNYSEDQLLEVIADGRSDMYCQIWHAIREKGTREKAPAVLINYLSECSEEWMDLNRAHCLDSLMKILKIKNQNIIDDFYARVVQMSAQKMDFDLFQKGVKDLKEYINMIKGH